MTPTDTNTGCLGSYRTTCNWTAVLQQTIRTVGKDCQVLQCASISKANQQS